MIRDQRLAEIPLSDLLTRIQEMFVEQYRLVQIGCTKLPDRIELNYSFDKNYQFVNLRVVLLDEKQEIPSVSAVYWSALFYENEIHDLYGLNIAGIVLDFKGTFYQTKEKHAFATCPPAPMKVASAEVVKVEKKGKLNE